jgi:RNA polymerase sigma-70 factor (ECF subfamily)
VPDRDEATHACEELDAIYREHVDFVWRVARRAGVSEEWLEDVVHDVFLVVQRRLAEVPDGSRIRGFLYAVTRGVVSNERRRRERRARRHRTAPAPAADRSPEQAAADAEAVALVESFLETLDPRQRLVFELVDIEGCRCPEVAELVGAPLNTIYSRLRLARQALARHVAAVGLERPA